MASIYFRNEKTGARYRVIRRFKDADGKDQVELQGKLASFVEPYDKERFKQLGYKLEVVDDE